MAEPRALSLGGAVTGTILPPIAKSAGALVPYRAEEVKEIGAASAGGVAAITDRFTALARTGDIDEVGQYLDKLLVQAKDYDPSKFAKSGLGGLFGKTIQQIKNRFQTVDTGIDQLVGEITKRVSLFENRVGDLEALHAANEEYITELDRTMATANERIAWMEINLPTVTPGNIAEAQTLDTWNQTIAYAKKRVDDLVRLKMLAQQQGPQIKLMALNSSTLAMKFRQIDSTVIPALKQAFTLYIINVEQTKGVKFANAIDDAFEAAVKANAKKLKQNTIDIHTALARPTLQLTTLQQTQKDLIESLDAVKQIRADMVTRIATERPALEALSKELAAKLGA